VNWTYFRDIEFGVWTGIILVTEFWVWTGLILQKCNLGVGLDLFSRNITWGVDWTYFREIEFGGCGLDLL
jgi:hypothetical protein